MASQKLVLSAQIQTRNGVPEKWREHFYLKRIDEEDLVITLEERNGILLALERGDRFVQIRKYTIMLNAMKSIDPCWGEKNIPPRPEIKWGGNDEEGQEWDACFGHLSLIGAKYSMR
mgnify:CR=1 FL=1